VANLTMTDMWAVASGPIVHHDRQKAMAETNAGQIAFDARRLSFPARTLSGGNQKKPVVGKMISVSKAKVQNSIMGTVGLTSRCILANSKVNLLNYLVVQFYYSD